MAWCHYAYRWNRLSFRLGMAYLWYLKNTLIRLRMERPVPALKIILIYFIKFELFPTDSRKKIHRRWGR